MLAAGEETLRDRASDLVQTTSIPRDICEREKQPLTLILIAMKHLVQVLWPETVHLPDQFATVLDPVLCDSGV